MTQVKSGPQAAVTEQSFISGLNSTPTMSNVTAQVMAAGALRWPGLGVGVDQLEQYLNERVASAESLTPVIASDLFLAFACLANVPNAVQLFHSTYDQIVMTTARHFDKSGALTDELWQRVAEVLFVGRGGRPPRIADYHGRGPLSAWVRTCARRMALRLAKVDNAEALMTREALADEISDACDQELALLKSHYGELFRQELLAALNELPAKDRMLLQLHLVAGLSTTRIAKMYHLNQSSVSRQLQRAATNTFTIIKQRVNLRLGVATAELESLLDLARSHIELSLSNLDDTLQDESPTTL